MGDGQQMYMCMSVCVCVGFCLYELTYALSLMLSESTLLEVFHVTHLVCVLSLSQYWLSSLLYF